MRKMILTTRQATFWFTLHQLGSALLVIPSTLVFIAKQDAWLAVPVALAAHLLLLLLYFRIANRLNGQTFHEHVVSILGKWGGGLCLVVFVMAYPFLTFTLVIRDLGDFLTGVMMPETPSEAIYLLMLAAVWYVVHGGVRTIGRTVELLFFAFLFLFVLLTVSLIPSMNMDYILPLFENGPKPIFLASISLFAFPYFESVLFLFLASHMQYIQQWKTVVVRSALLSGGMFFLVVFVVIGVISQGVVADVAYPSFFVVRTISIGGFFERFEVIVAVLWYITIFFRLSLLLYVSSYALAGIFRLKDWRSLLIPLCTLGFFIAPLTWPNTSVQMQSIRAWPYYTVLFGVLFPMVIWLIGSFRGNHGKK